MDEIAPKILKINYIGDVTLKNLIDCLAYNL
jgi:hypothetical protein